MRTATGALPVKEANNIILQGDVVWELDLLEILDARKTRMGRTKFTIEFPIDSELLQKVVEDGNVVPHDK